MQANLDMGGNRIINVGSPVDDNDAVRLVDIVGLEGGEGGIVTWDSILGKPSSFTPSAHTHTTDNVTGLVELIEDTMGSKITAGTNVSVAYNDGTGTVTISASGGGGGGSGPIVSIDDFGAIGDNTTDNKDAFDAAEADPDVDWIYIPEGRYYTTNAITSLTKSYWGPGTIRLSAGDVLPGRFTQVTTNPSPRNGLGASGWFAQDNRFRPEYFRLAQGLRKGLTENYFEATTQPYSQWFTTGAGWSGISARLASGVSSGATTATLNNTAGFNNGDVIGFVASTAGGAPTDTVTITNIVGNNITFTPALTTNYSANHVVTHGMRTNHPLYYQRLTTTGGGDSYGIVTRTNMNYVPLAGQTHFFETATFGLYGGDSYFGAHGNFTTGLEMAYHDAGYDSAVIASVQSFVRDNDTSAYKGVWIGDYYKSEGSKPADVGWALAGKWRVGLDTVRADLTTFNSTGDNVNAAVNMALGQKIYFNSTASNAGRGGSAIYGTFYGNTVGDMLMESGNDGTSDFIAIRFNRSPGNDARLRIRPAGIQMNTALTCTGTALFNGDVGVGMTSAFPRLTFGDVNVYIYWDGVNLRATKDGNSSSVVIV